MIAGRKRWLVLAVCLSLILAMMAAMMAGAEVLMPESGNDVKKNGDLTVDQSHADQGYVLIKSKKGNKKLKLRIGKSKDTILNYDLNSDGEYESFPLQFGSGKYQIILYKQASGKKYSEEGKLVVSAQMPDELTAFLYPNQYVNYTPETECVVTAGEICAGMTDQEEIFKTVCSYITSHFVYDFVKSVSVKAGVLPDIDGCWKNHMGICQDLSAVTCAMLRSQGVPARLMIGTLGANTYHAWVVAVVNGKDTFFDPTAELNASSKTETYTTERYY